MIQKLRMVALKKHAIFLSNLLSLFSFEIFQLAYGVRLLGKQYDMNFLAPSSHNPLKEHGFLGETYAGEIKRER